MQCVTASNWHTIDQTKFKLNARLMLRNDILYYISMAALVALLPVMISTNLCLLQGIAGDGISSLDVNVKPKTSLLS